MEGEAGSINAVANFITQLKRSGYFDKVEIKDAKENDLCRQSQTYGFTMTAAISAAARLRRRPKRSDRRATRSLRSLRPRGGASHGD